MNATDRQSAMNQLIEQSFILEDIRLFLDTHLDCPEAGAAYREALRNRLSALNAYEATFGPLHSDRSSDDSARGWVQGPWPWEWEA